MIGYEYAYISISTSTTKRLDNKLHEDKLHLGTKQN